MHIHVTSGAPSVLKAEALVVPVFSDGRLDGAAEAVDVALGAARAALDLAGAQDGMDRVPDVLCGPEADHFGLEGIEVDLDLRDKYFKLYAYY